MARTLRDPGQQAETRRIQGMITPGSSEGEMEVTRVLAKLIEGNGYPRRCINVVIVDRYGEGWREGYAATPSRLTIISSNVVSGRMSSILAHELGHNLSPRHVSQAGNLMEPEITGTELTGKQYAEALRNCRAGRERIFDHNTCGRGDGILGAFREREELADNIREAEETLESLRNELKNLGNKVREYRRMKQALWRRMRDAEYIYRHVRSLAGKVERHKARKDRKALEKLREKTLRLLEKKRERAPADKWVKIYEERLRMIDGEPRSVLEKLKAVRERLRKEYEECKKYAATPEAVEEELRKKIEAEEERLTRMRERLRNLDRILGE